MRILAKFILKIAKWQAIENKNLPKKAVFLVAPHTSSVDFLMGWLYSKVYGIRIKFLIKKEFFFFPLGMIIKNMGGVPVDRDKNVLAKKICSEFKTGGDFYLVVTAEGTRKATKNWKKGFIFIAKNADVPIAVGILNYKKKTMSLNEVVYPNDPNFENIDFYKSFYEAEMAKHPTQFDK